MKIFINAGHGGKDSGAVSINGFLEKDINKTVAGFLTNMLIQKGFNVEYYQQTESVNQVVEVEKKSNSDLFISIHCNSSDKPSASGVEVLYYPTSGTGKAVAEIFSNSISEYMEIKNRGAKARSDLRVLSGTVAPAVLIELAFVSNPDEEKLLVDEPYGFASGIMKGIHKWMA